ncbi:MAG: isoprenylcysteine carboxylmethyltransferase family protein [Oscillospiraceae bacterium]|nr:isoprenylcysteine carboxylmethyltransferase family protein [Oscillospiraceae bacterium]
MKLLLEALTKFACGLLLVGSLIFLPAGTIAYTYGWLLIGQLFVPMLIAGLVMMVKSPELLKKRLDAKEKQAAQKGVVALSGLMFIAGFVVAGLDFRFGWSTMPAWVVITASVLFLVSYALYARVMRENAYLSRTIKVEEGQTVVNTGMYGIVRHPMYAVTVLLFLMIPLVLGSWYALIVFAFYPAVIVVRLKDEEELLTRELPGYCEYKQKVKYRIIPFIW